MNDKITLIILGIVVLVLIIIYLIKKARLIKKFKDNIMDDLNK